MKYPLKKVPMTDKTIKIFLADDHTIVRQGLAKLLEAEPGFEVIGEAEDRAGLHPELVAELRRIMLSARTESEHFPFPEIKERSF